MNAKLNEKYHPVTVGSEAGLKRVCFLVHFRERFERAK